MESAALLFLFIFLLGVAIWGELGPNGTWSKVRRASEDLERREREGGRR